MIRRTKDYILENKMINNHSTVLVALSGGADSVCLLLLLNEIKRQCADELDFALEAVHVEHGIRGAESIWQAWDSKSSHTPPWVACPAAKSSAWPSPAPCA